MRVRGFPSERNDYDRGVIDGQPEWQGRALPPPGARTMHSAIVKRVFDAAHDARSNGGARASAGKSVVGCPSCHHHRRYGKAIRERPAQSVRRSQVPKDLGLARGIGILRLFTGVFDPERVRTIAYERMCESPVLAVPGSSSKYKKTRFGGPLHSR